MHDSPHLAGIHLYPIKSLDGVSVPEWRIGPGGGLELDRVWALYSEDGRVINGKSTAAIHLIRAAFATDVRSVTLSAADGRRDVPAQTFGFPGNFAAAGEWFSRFFERDVVVRCEAEGFPDDTERTGPTVVSTATLHAVSEWFPGMEPEEARRRFRTSLEIGGVPAFWEDRLFGAHERDAVRFTIGDVKVEGTNPCPRCPVPARDSLSGVDMLGFQRHFSDRRRAQYPSWACQPDRIDSFYHLAINTRVAPSEHGKALRVGDVVALR
ncbi:MAG: MOSC N-terminal beta barrel domain-containing protein [Acidobacteria bacterium]|nr:MOSC N-terminal beta barrel domain-containing protein [Acidobacteriota bacterium]